MSFFFKFSCLVCVLCSIAFLGFSYLEMTHHMMTYGILMLALMVIIHDESV